MKPALYTTTLLSIITGLSLQLVQQVAGQAQEGGPASSIDNNDDTSNGYFSYVSDMDSAASVRQAMETLSWASVGESWVAVAVTPESTSEEVQATPSSSPEAAYATSEVAAVSQPPASTGTVLGTDIAPASTTSTKNGTNTLALELGIGIPVGLLLLLSLAGALIYKKRKAYKKDFEKRTSNLRQMSQAEV